MAEQEWENGHSSVPDPGISPDERWAIYYSNPQLHKLTGNLTGTSLSFNAATQYLM